MTPRVSVVVPTFNNAEYVAETIQSILGQTYRAFELLIADHASNDGTWEILQSFAADPRVLLLRTQAGGGAQRNWNRVSMAARGEWLKLVCGDDVIYPSHLEKQLAAVDNAAGRPIGVVASRRDIVDANGRRVFADLGLGGLRGHVSGELAIRQAVRRGTNIFGEPCCTLLRRDVLERVGWWEGRHGYLIDEATYCKILLRGDLLAVPETLAAFRLSSSQWSVRLANQQARQVSAVHRSLQARLPDVLTRRDVRVGNVRAHARALQRRLVYLGLRRRMRPSQSPTAS